MSLTIDHRPSAADLLIQIDCIIANSLRQLYMKVAIVVSYPVNKCDYSMCHTPRLASTAGVGITLM